MSNSSVVSLTAILALTSVARGAEKINDDTATDGQSLETEQSYDANRYKAQQEQYHSNTRQRRIANNKQRRLVNRRRRGQSIRQQKQRHRQAQFASTSQRPQQPNATSQTTSQTSPQTTTQLAAPKCGPTSGTHHSPYIGCYTDKLNDRIMSFELSGKYHSGKSAFRICLKFSVA